MSYSKITKDAHDTGWTESTLITDNFSSGEIKYKKIGNVVFLTVYSASTTKTGMVTMYTMPAGYRPAKRWTVPVSYPHLSGDSYINIDIDGHVQLINQTGGAVTNVYFTTAYPVT